jgi:hypothetical protein
MKIEPRLEKKIFIKNNKLNYFKNWLQVNSAYKLYDDRVVNSIYYDNNRFQSFYDSEEGVAPRKKIRIRFYENLKEYRLEKKYTFQSYRAKTSSKVIIKNLNNSLSDSNYGLVRPKVKISYLRSYYKLNSYRITIDRNITYKRVGSIFLKKEKDIIVEVKSSINAEKNFNFLFPFPLIRFSKYSKAINLIYSK